VSTGAPPPPVLRPGGASSPVQVPTSGLQAAPEEGPLHFTARALKAQLQTVFPPSRFDFQYLDGKIGKQQWARLTRRTPAVALGWAGVEPGANNGSIFFGTSLWVVALITRNEAGPQQRLLGDAIAPGILSMVRAATLALQGFAIDPPDTPWAASGAVQVRNVAALYSDEWTDEACAVAGVDIAVEYQELLPPSFDAVNAMDALSIDWAFGPTPSATQWSDLNQLGGAQ
jgi:hypothetical protein